MNVQNNFYSPTPKDNNSLNNNLFTSTNRSQLESSKKTSPPSTSTKLESDLAEFKVNNKKQLVKNEEKFFIPRAKKVRKANK